MEQPRQSGDWKAGLDAISLTHELARCCGLSAADWASLLRRALALEADPLDLAIGEGVIPEERFLTVLAQMLGAEFWPTAPRPAPGTISEEAFAMRSYRGMDLAGNLIRVMSPTGAQTGLLFRQFTEGRLPRLALTPRAALLATLVDLDRDRLGRRILINLPESLSARPSLPYDDPASSSRQKGVRRIAPVLFVVAISTLIAMVVAFPLQAIVIIPLVLLPVFAIAGLSVIIATLGSFRRPYNAPPLHDAHLPRYSVLIPLYKEGNIVEALIARIRALAYPRDRIEVLFLVEEEDAETRAALARISLPNWMLVLPVPEGAPRTKPRALNAALPFCTGDLLVVFDAEDAPDPDQLLRAAALFSVASSDVACLQARLAIANPRDGFLTRRFAIEYAALFDCTKAGAARLGWAVPLGGSSNHFRLPVLRQIGGWDTWNVTEDADLGIRLARFGWLVEDLPSTTWEEAPRTLAGWMHQRARWMKGWMQTLMVQSRMPLQMISQLGFVRMLIIASMGAATLLGALLYPAFLLAILTRLLSATPFAEGPGLLKVADILLVAGMVMAVTIELVPSLVAIVRRRAYFLLPWLLLAPVSHMLVSWAAWRGLRELLRDPYHWNKTAHGEAHTLGGLAPAEWDRDFRVPLQSRVRSKAPKSRASSR